MRDLPAELGHALEEGACLGVGLAFLSWQRAQVRRRELARSPLPPYRALAALAGAVLEPTLLPLRRLCEQAGGRSGR